jgi:hypothetical protein
VLKGRVLGLFDKGKGALMTTETLLVCGSSGATFCKMTAGRQRSEACWIFAPFLPCPLPPPSIRENPRDTAKDGKIYCKAIRKKKKLAALKKCVLLRKRQHPRVC